MFTPQATQFTPTPPVPMFTPAPVGGTQTPAPSEAQQQQQVPLTDPTQYQQQHQQQPSQFQPQMPQQVDNQYQVETFAITLHFCYFETLEKNNTALDCSSFSFL